MESDRSPTRFAGFLSDDEQAWLSGTGAEPRTLADRLPPRAPEMVPRPGQGDWVAVLRHERVHVVDGAVLHTTRSGSRVLAPAGAVVSASWLVDDAPIGVGLAPDHLGWLVLGGADGVLVALALSEWSTGDGAASTATGAVRRSGAEAVAEVLGTSLVVVTDPAAAGSLGRVPPDRVVTLRARRPRWYDVMTGLALVSVTAALVLPGLHPLRWAPEVLLLAAAATVGRRAELLRSLSSAGWTGTPYVASQTGSGPVGLRVSPPTMGSAGDDLVVSDGAGWEARLPGPRLGGAGAVLVARDSAGRPWSLMVLDRDEHAVLRLPGASWDMTEQGVRRLGEALTPAGLVVVGAQITPPAGPVAGWPPAPATPPWRAHPEPIAVTLLLVVGTLVTVLLAADRSWAGFAVGLAAIAVLVSATPLARVMSR